MTARGASGTILLADTSVALLTCVGGALRDAGYSVRQASTAGEALNIVRAEPVALLVAAAELPDLCGPDLAAKAWEEVPELLVVLMTGYLSSEGAVCHRALVLTKPFTPSAILQTVAQALEQHARRGA